MAELTVKELREQLLTIIEKALALRFDKGLQPKAEDGPAELHERLIHVRANLDRLEHMLVQTVTAKSHQSGVVRQARETQEDAWAASAQSTRTPEYTSAKERDARITLGTFETKVVLRRAEAMLAEAEFTVDQLRTLYRGLDGLRRDMETLLRAKSLATSLER